MCGLFILFVVYPITITIPITNTITLTIHYRNPVNTYSYYHLFITTITITII